jgi:hypothetical protein
MHPIRDLNKPTLYLNSSFFANLGSSPKTRTTQNKSFASYVGYAIQILHENDLVPPEEDRVTLIVESALAAQSLFFVASLHHPEQAELHQIFEAFVLNCIMPPEKRSYPCACPSND